MITDPELIRSSLVNKVQNSQAIPDLNLDQNLSLAQQYTLLKSQDSISTLSIFILFGYGQTMEACIIKYVQWIYIEFYRQIFPLR